MLRRALLLACVLSPWLEAHAATWDAASRNVGFVPLRVGTSWGLKPKFNQHLTLWYRLYPSRPPDLTLSYWNEQLAPFEVGVRATVRHDPHERRAVLCLKRRLENVDATLSLEGFESKREL